MQLYKKEVKTCYWRHRNLLSTSGFNASRKDSIPTKTQSSAFWKRFQRPPNWKSESKKAIYQKSVILPTEGSPFESAPLILSRKAKFEGAAKIQVELQRWISKRKEPLHSNSQISLPVMMTMKESTHVHPILKKLLSKQKCAQARCIKEFLPAWKLLTKD